jgi:predicted nucleic acid-binding protein
LVVYLDTSALLKLYVEEEGHELVREAVGAAELAATSTVAYAEARAGLARRLREGDFTEEEHRGAVEDLLSDWPTYARLDASDPVSQRAGELAERHALRGFDSIHLASALRLSERFEDLRFLAFDKRLTTAARDASLNLYESGTDPRRVVGDDPGHG